MTVTRVVYAAAAAAAAVAVAAAAVIAAVVPAVAAVVDAAAAVAAVSVAVVVAVDVVVVVVVVEVIVTCLRCRCSRLPLSPSSRPTRWARRRQVTLSPRRRAAPPPLEPHPRRPPVRGPTCGATPCPPCREPSNAPSSWRRAPYNSVRAPVEHSTTVSHSLVIIIIIIIIICFFNWFILHYSTNTISWHS